LTSLMPDTRQPSARLLGRAGPDLTCEQCFDHLDLYVELQVASEDAEDRIAGMNAHLTGCPACAEEAESLLALVSAE
jgi:hypothetical protein